MADYNIKHCEIIMFIIHKLYNKHLHRSLRTAYTATNGTCITVYGTCNTHEIQNYTHNGQLQ